MTKKHTFRCYSEYDIKGIIEYLNIMAVKGWLLEKKQGVYYRFVKTDKPFIKYDVTYFADASKENDFLPCGADRYIEMAEAGGWQFLTNDNKMQIFISENPDATQLETEAHIKVDVIHKSFVSQWLFLYLLMVFNGFLRFLGSNLIFSDIMFILFSSLQNVCQKKALCIWVFRIRYACCSILNFLKR